MSGIIIQKRCYAISKVVLPSVSFPIRIHGFTTANSISQVDHQSTLPEENNRRDPAYFEMTTIWSAVDTCP